MRYFYTVVFYLLLPVILLRLWIKNRKKPGALKHWHERLGLGLRPTPTQVIWLHAVSVGESIAATPLIKQLRQRYPDIPIVVTGETIGGAERIRAGLGDQVYQLYAPYDVPCALKKFFQALQPRLIILMEMELWPNLLAEARQRNVPVILANARLSARSALGYHRILSVTEEMFLGLTQVIAQTQKDADRFIALGLPAERTHVTGSIKFDLELPEQLAEKAQALRALWGEERWVWIAASTQDGEEEQIIEAFTQVREKLGRRVLLVSVPRHPERAPRIEALYQRHGYQVVKRSDQRPCTMETDVFLGDSMGELLIFYAASDLAFVGGSLIEHGGQNPLEPAAVGLPILTGPHTFNFAVITEQLLARGAEIKVSNATQLAENVIALLSDAERCRAMGCEAKKFVEENKGSLLKHRQILDKWLETV
jgi:3-deoxy-D-manno-octulosonic-acid transferase